MSGAVPFATLPMYSWWPSSITEWMPKRWLYLIHLCDNAEQRWPAARTRNAHFRSFWIAACCTTRQTTVRKLVPSHAQSAKTQRAPATHVVFSRLSHTRTCTQACKCTSPTYYVLHPFRERNTVHRKLHCTGEILALVTVNILIINNHYLINLTIKTVPVKTYNENS